MASKVILEILTSDNPQTALARVSQTLQSLSGYKIDSIKSSPSTNLLRTDSKIDLNDSSTLDDLNDSSNLNQLQKAIKENKFSELKANNQARLDAIQKEQETKEFLAEKAILDARQKQNKRIVNANKYKEI